MFCFNLDPKNLNDHAEKWGNIERKTQVYTVQCKLEYTATWAGGTGILSDSGL